MTSIIKADLSRSAHQRAVCQLLNIYIKDSMGGGTPLDRDAQRQLIDGLSSNPNSLVLLALSNNEFIGMTICFINFTTFMVKKMINIHDIIVRPDKRNKGVGRMLLDAVIEEAEELECGKVTLEVREDNTNAHHLYESLGFAECDPVMHFLVKKI